MKIALTGNPNSGKTTLFNAITGQSARVGNWTGVTVEKREGKIKETLNKSDLELVAIDLPGAYSMNPYTDEENVTKDYILNEKPDVIINIRDATKLSRGLFFTTQLLELGIPVVVALNKSDLTSKKGTKINTGLLSQYLHCPIIETTSTKASENGLLQLVSECVRHIENPHKQIPPRIDGLKEATNEKEHVSADRKRFGFVNEVVMEVERKQISASAQTKQDKLDRIVAHKWFGIPIFIIVIFLMFSISQTWLGPHIADLLVGWLEGIQAKIGELFAGASPVVYALLIDGIIGGVIAVVGFIPLIMVLFFLMALLEDCGYMARVAVVMDRFFKKIGLSGRSIIPMVIGTACGIPGVMASRTIKDVRQRRTTAMLTPFMPCGAKLPIIALFAGVFFAGNAWVGTSMYFLAIVIIVISALVIRKITGDTSKSYFILELPEYRVPSVKRAAVSMFSRAKGFIVKATTIILLCNVIIHMMQTFTWSFKVAENAGDSILASVASPFAILFIPLGFGVWQFAAAAITGFIAKENVVGTLAVVFGVSSFIDAEAFELTSNSAAGGVEQAFSITAVAGLSYLVFNLFTPPCVACIGALRTELNSTKWTIGAVGFQLAVGYIVAFIVYQVGTFITVGEMGVGFIPGLIAVVAMCSYIAYLMYKGSSTK